MTDNLGTKTATMNPREFYQHLVAKHGVSDYVAPLLSERTIRKLIKEMGLVMSKETAAEVIKDFSTHGNQLLINRIVAEIENAISEPGRSKFKGKVFAGDFPTGRFNAHAVKVPDESGYVFLLNVGLMQLIYDTAKILCSQVRWANFDSEGKPVSGSETGATEVNYDEAGGMLKDLIHKYLKFKKWTVPENRLVIRDGPRNMILAMVVMAAERFVLAHEFGHAMLGHLDRNVYHSLAVPEIGINVSVISNNQKDEFAADVTGGALMLMGLPKRIDDPLKVLSMQIVVAGPFLFFELARLIEKVARVRYTSHPPTQQRAQLLNQAFSKLPEQAFSLSKSFVGLLRSFEKFL